MSLPKERLHQTIKSSFSKDEIRTLCFSLGINPEELDNKTISTMTESLLVLVEKQGRIIELIHLFEGERPNVNWIELAFADVSVPYRGLMSFREEDAHLFYGRDSYTDLLFDAVHKKSMVAVIGPSGCGKSSLVFAGLIPRLRQTGKWNIIDFRPGQNPFDALSIELLPLLEPDLPQRKRMHEVNELSKDLSLKKLSLSQVVAPITKNMDEGRQLLMFVDQFEELYTQTGDPHIQNRFVNALLSLNESTSVTLLITIRADFLARALSSRLFADAIQAARQMIGPMNRDELLDVMERPLSGTFVSFELGLTTRILDDVGQEPGNLPLLEFALTSLWDKQVDGKLTFAAYEKIGKVEGALTDYAEKVFDTFEAKGKADLMQRLFVQLVQPVAESVNTKRTAKRNELSAELWLIAMQLADARLTVTAQNEKGEETVELAHEALITNWSRFENWIQEDWDFRVWQERLRANLYQWHLHENDEGFLLRDGQLVLGKEWLEQRHDDLTAPEISFIKASLEKEKQRQIADDERRQRELKLMRERAEEAEAREQAETLRADEQKRSSKIFRIGAGVLFLLFSAAIIAAIFAFAGQNAANNARATSVISENLAIDARGTSDANASVALTRENEAQISAATATYAQGQAVDSAVTAEANLLQAWKVQSLNFANLSNQYLELGDQSTALLLALQAAEHYPEVDESQARSALFNALTSPVRQSLHISHDDNIVTGAMWNKDETRILTWSPDKTARIWDARTGQPVVTIYHDRSVWGATWNNSGSQIATRTSDGKVHIWDSSSGNLVLELRHGNNNYVLHIQWNEAESKILTTTISGDVYIWDATYGNLIDTLSHDLETEGLYSRVFWSPTDDRILHWLQPRSQGNGGETLVRVWTPGNGLQETVILDQGYDRYNAVVWSPDGTKVGIAYLVGVRIWDAQTGRMLHDLEPTISSQFGVKWNNDGSKIMAWSQENIVRIWDTETGSLIQELIHQGPTAGLGGGMVRGATWFPEMERWTGNRDRILTWSHSQPSSSPSIYSAQVWSGRGNLIYTMPHNTAVQSAVWSHNGQYILTRSEDNLVRVWQGETGKLEYILFHDDKILEATWSQDDSKILTLSSDGVARVWSFQQLNVRFEGTTIQDSWNISGSQLFYRSGTSEYQIWDFRTDEVVTIEIPDIIGRRNTLWSPLKAQLLFYAYLESDIYVWDTKAEETIVFNHDGEVDRANWLSGTEKVLTWTTDNEIFIWNTQTKYNEFSFTSSFEIRDILWNLAKEQIAIVSTYRIQFVDISTGDMELEIETSDNSINENDVSWNNQGSKVIIDTGEIGVWDAQSGELIYLLNTNSSEDPYITTVWSNDGTKILIWSSRSDIATVLDALTGEELFSIDNSEEWQGVAWSPDDARILTWTANKTHFIWNAENGDMMLRLQDEIIDEVGGSPLAPSGAVWNSTGQSILSWDQNGRVRLWDAQTGETFLKLEQEFPVSSAELLEDEGLLITQAGNEIKAWNLNYEDLLDIGYSNAIPHRLNNTARTNFAMPTLPPLPSATPFPSPTPDTTLLSIDSSAMNLVYGPVEQQLNHDEDGQSESILAAEKIDDFVVEVDFINPYSADEGLWSHGIIFRDNDSGAYWLRYNSEGSWNLILYEDIIDGFTWIQSGDLTGLNTNLGEMNSLKLIVKGTEGLFIVNGQVVSDLDLGILNENGSVYIVTGAQTGSELPGSVTNVENLSVYSIDEQ